MPTVEQKTAGAILEKPKEVVIGGVTYQVAPPSTATLILVSELVSQLPKVQFNDDVDIISRSLKVAKDCKVNGDIVATLILGAKVINNWKPTRIKDKVRLLISNKSDKSIYFDPLVKSILEDISPKALSDMTLDLLTGMETGDFFGLTTFLIEINLTKTTREVVT